MLIITHEVNVRITHLHLDDSEAGCLLDGSGLIGLLNLLDTGLLYRGKTR